MRASNHKYETQPSMRDLLNGLRQIKSDTSKGQPNSRLDNAIKVLSEDFSNSNNEEFQEIMQAVSQAVNAPVTITNNDEEKGEVRGVIKFNSIINFTMAPQNDGLYITTDNLQLDEDVLQAIMKLRAYFEQWQQQAIQRLNGTMAQ